nr:hypothetical protein Itr_chr02CG25260 [Ipomoea trifida]GMC59173.1 hypothetical protein Iba_chr02aCG22300 [Ipomoea batatas]GMC63833.1 hypothetical protein Iba_chr02cCG16980 [Ipomoea batatas]
MLLFPPIDPFWSLNHFGILIFDMFTLHKQSIVMIKIVLHNKTKDVQLQSPISPCCRACTNHSHILL